MRHLGLFLPLALVATVAMPHPQTKEPLDIQFIDVEGSQLTLFVSPPPRGRDVGQGARRAGW